VGSNILNYGKEKQSYSKFVFSLFSVVVSGSVPLHYLFTLHSLKLPFSVDERYGDFDNDKIL